MKFTFISYVLSAVQIFFPLYYLYRLWTRKFKNQLSWLTGLVVCIGFLLFFYFAGRWDTVGYLLRYILYGIYAIVACLSFYRVKDLPFYKKDSFSWLALTDLVIIVGLAGWVFLGFSHSKKALNISFPLQGDSYYVAQGGAAYPLNYHGAFADMQQYALDITQLNEWGLRAWGIYPADLSEYEIFGRPVYSPIAGKVVQLADTLKDLSPPDRLPAQPTGNHIWIKKGDVYLVLAHLQQHSIVVEVGDSVSVNEPLGRVGNTGNTSEPHLHMHAIRSNRSETVPIDSLPEIGEAVPLHIQNSFLVRNDIISNKE